MALLGQLKRRLGRGSAANDETGLRGNAILSEMARDRGQAPAKADKGLEEKAKRSLENFYVPETIDVGSIRPLAVPENPPPPPLKKAAFPPPNEECQLELDIGDRLLEAPPFGKTVDLGKVSDDQWQRVLEGYLVPWALYRQGLVSFEEIEERLERVSLDFSPEFSQKLDESLHLSFVRVENDLFAVDPATKRKAEQVIEKAASYFYRDEIRYPLGDLVHWIVKEFAMSWENFPAEFVEKCLTLSSRFTLYREVTCEICIRENLMTQASHLRQCSPSGVGS